MGKGEGQPFLAYLCTFTNDSPLIRIDVHLHQNQPRDWLLVRLNQLNFGKDAPFTQWAVGGPRRSGQLDEAKGSQKSTDWKLPTNWAALYNDRFALGLISPPGGDARPFIYIYNDKSYYLNGSYGAWKTTDRQVTHYLYLGHCDGIAGPFQ